MVMNRLRSLLLAGIALALELSNLYWRVRGVLEELAQRLDRSSTLRRMKMRERHP